MEYHFVTTDPQEALKIFQALGVKPASTSTAAGSIVTPGPLAPVASAPVPAFAAPLPVSTAAAAPAPAPAPAPAAAPRGVAPDGWTEAHIAHAAKAHADSFGPASLKAIVQEFGAARATLIDPARWPEAYERLMANIAGKAAA